MYMYIYIYIVFSSLSLYDLVFFLFFFLPLSLSLSSLFFSFFLSFSLSLSLSPLSLSLLLSLSLSLFLSLSLSLSPLSFSLPLSLSSLIFSHFIFFCSLSLSLSFLFIFSLPVAQLPNSEWEWSSQCVSADGKRYNAFRLKKPDYATFSREIRGRNALQRVSLAHFLGKRSIIWLFQKMRCNAFLFLQTAGVATRFVCRSATLFFWEIQHGKRVATRFVAFPENVAIIWLIQTKRVARLPSAQAMCFCRRQALQRVCVCSQIMQRFPGKFAGETRFISPANFPGKRSIIWFFQTKRVATLSVCRNTGGRQHVRCLFSPFILYLQYKVPKMAPQKTFLANFSPVR